MEKRELDRDLKRMGRKRKGGENQTDDDAPLLAGASRGDLCERGFYRGMDERTQWNDLLVSNLTMAAVKRHISPFL